MTRPPHDLSFSQWRAWQTCPRQAHARYVLRQYTEPPTEAMALGAVVDAAITQPGRLLAVESENASLLLTRKGEHTAEYARTLRLARAVLALPWVQRIIEGAVTQAELTADIGGATWLCYPDIIRVEHRQVIDVKTCPAGPVRDWDRLRRRHVDWPTSRLYGFQLAAYRVAAAARFGGEPSDWTGAILAVPKATAKATMPGVDPGDPLPASHLRLFRQAQLAEYQRRIEECWQYDHLSMTGLGPLPPIRAMKREPDNAALIGCTECEWCLSHGEIVRPWEDPEIGGVR